MTEPEQVALDALRAAGHDKLADNFVFAVEAVKLRQLLSDLLEWDDGRCASCGADSLTGHFRDCALVPMLSGIPGWLRLEIENAHRGAIEEDKHRTAIRRSAKLGDALKEFGGLG